MLPCIHVRTLLRRILILKQVQLSEHKSFCLRLIRWCQRILLCLKLLRGRCQELESILFLNGVKQFYLLRNLNLSFIVSSVFKIKKLLIHQVETWRWVYFLCFLLILPFVLPLNYSPLSQWWFLYWLLLHKDHCSIQELIHQVRRKILQDPICLKVILQLAVQIHLQLLRIFFLKN